MKITLFNQRPQSSNEEMVIHDIERVWVTYRGMVRVTFTDRESMALAVALTGWGIWDEQAKCINMPYQNDGDWEGTVVTYDPLLAPTHWADWRIER